MAAKRQGELFADLKTDRDMWVFERRLAKDGYVRIAGTDEAGRGPLAGPVVAAAVILPAKRGMKRWDGLTDSKLLTEAERDRFFDLIQRHALGVGVGIVEPEVIDSINILQASLLAMRQAVESLDPPPDFVLVDGNQSMHWPKPHMCVVKGDRRSLSVAAASVIAKVRRDRIMADLHRAYPDYNFLGNKGYGTLEHRRALAAVGPCPAHRKTFNHVRPTGR